MLRSRVRRSFTVEVKSKTRQSQSWPNDPAPSPVNWAALDPAPETPSSFEAFWSDAAADAAPPVPAEKPRRILQSLIVAEPEPDISEPPAEREAPLPRVRRVKPPLPRSDESRTEPARPGATWSFSDIADAAEDGAVAPSQTAHQPPAADAAPAPPRKPSKARTAETAFAPGERWKRRLPRSCW